MRRTGKRKAKTGFHNVEQDRTEGTVYSGPDLRPGVDENLYRIKKNSEDESLREQKKESWETAS